MAGRSARCTDVDTLLIVLSGLLVGGAWSVRSQGGPIWLVAGLVAAAALSLAAALVGG
ncbi:MAG: hypothetical protein M3386_02575 [Actinomycetota bacterium]|nr:hypothetical protein [Nocardioidaceae bacterium]MDQ3591768.1 hypothetical protein [Actinomycetota bacterium]